MITRFNRLFKFSFCSFTQEMLKSVILDAGNKSTIYVNNKDYVNAIKKISLLEKEKKIDSFKDIQSGNNLHLKIYSNKDRIQLNFEKCKACELDLSGTSHNLKNLNLQLKESELYIKKEISKPQTEIEILMKTSNIKIKKIKSLKKIKINKGMGKNSLDIDSLVTECFEIYLTENDEFKCNLIKILNDSLLDFAKIDNVKLHINRVTLFTLINVFDIHLNKFINLPLGVLGGKIGSTSFPTLIINNHEHQKIRTNISHFKSKLTFSFMSKGILFLYISALTLYLITKQISNRKCNEIYSKFKVHQLKLYKILNNKI